MKSALVKWVAAGLLGLLAAGARVQAAAPDVNRFFFSGDGHIRLLGNKNGKSFDGRYRLSRGSYDPAALEAICRVFGAPYAPQKMGLSLRLIEFIDLLQDRLSPGARITITSGYRNPEYNRKLRKRGSLAAKASLHQYGMAADLKMAGVPARRVWEYVKALGFGGAGYYQGDAVHIDVGPARSWDEKTSGVGTGISDDNKLIGLVTDYDVYRPGEMMTLRFIRMTAFPIAVSSAFALSRQDAQGGPEEVAVLKPIFAVPADGACPRFADIDQMASIRARLAADLPPGRYKMHARFCNNPWSDMPPEISTPAFAIQRP
ncbi:MAG: YcbK family protein [Desulfobacterales bacterium]|nr:MAG: YcbK family protein [Desulfobacterales bacterium]